jgi:hypothetical protein
VAFVVKTYSRKTIAQDTDKSHYPATSGPAKQTKTLAIRAVTKRRSQWRKRSMPNLTLAELVEEIERRKDNYLREFSENGKTQTLAIAGSFSMLLGWIKERQGTDAGK